MEPKRKINRLTEYDYAQSGAYFITICTHGRQKICGIAIRSRKSRM